MHPPTRQDRFVAYERVPTDRQGKSELGLGVQRQAIDVFAASRGAEVTARITEVESGRTQERPKPLKGSYQTNFA